MLVIPCTRCNGAVVMHSPEDEYLCKKCAEAETKSLSKRRHEIHMRYVKPAVSAS